MKARSAILGFCYLINNSTTQPDSCYIISVIIRIGLENNFEHRSLAWALDLPGCFAYGTNASEALATMLRAVLGYKAWLESHTPESWMADLGDFDIRLVETFEDYTIDEDFEIAETGYEVDAFFRHDWKPLHKTDIERGLQLLKWTRADLMELAGAIPPDRFDLVLPGEKWSIRGVLAHLAKSEFWYLSRLDLASGRREDLPEDVFESLLHVRALVDAILPTLEDSILVTGKSGEFWSPRKLLRVAIWHELDHTNHILKMLSA
jgi:hypothetical protein